MCTTQQNKGEVGYYVVTFDAAVHYLAMEAREHAEMQETLASMVREGVMVGRRRRERPPCQGWCVSMVPVTRAACRWCLRRSKICARTCMHVTPKPRAVLCLLCSVR
jgi:hypothetical protein